VSFCAYVVMADGMVRVGQESVGLARPQGVGERRGLVPAAFLVLVVDENQRSVGAAVMREARNQAELSSDLSVFGAYLLNPCLPEGSELARIGPRLRQIEVVCVIEVGMVRRESLLGAAALALVAVAPGAARPAAYVLRFVVRRGGWRPDLGGLYGELGGNVGGVGGGGLSGDVGSRGGRLGGGSAGVGLTGL